MILAVWKVFRVFICFHTVVVCFQGDSTPCFKLNHSDTIGGTTSGCSCSSLCAASERSVTVNFEINPLQRTQGFQE